MESFSLVGANGWQTLRSLLTADATFSGKFIWTMFSIRNTDGTNSIIVKTLPGSTSPSTDSGINLAPEVGFTWDAGNQGIIDGAAIWIKCSGADTNFDVSIIRKTGV